MEASLTTNAIRASVGNKLEEEQTYETKGDIVKFFY